MIELLQPGGWISPVQVEELERLVTDERRKFQVVAKRLAEQQLEADKNAQQRQDDWDEKIRELQKEKFALSIRLQVQNCPHPLGHD
jgi:hypothetical protein